MMVKPNLTPNPNLTQINIHQYERYLPSAFDGSLTMLEKINKTIHFLHEYSAITETMLTKWNEVYAWVMNEGLDETVGYRLNEWLRDGTFNRIINTEIFNELNNKITDVVNNFDVLKNDVTTTMNKFISQIDKDYRALKEDFYMIGETTIFRGE